MTRRAIVVGGSVGGLFAGVLLRSRGWEVEIYERASELADRGAGLTTHPALFRAIDGAGFQLRRGDGVRSVGRLLFGRDGDVLGAHDMAQVMTSWAHIYTSLRAQVPDAHYHTDCALTGIEQEADGVLARFSDGSVARGDWLIGADGARSTVRELLDPGSEPRYCGYFIWRGLIDEEAIPGDVLAEVSHRMAFGIAAGGHWLGYLVAGRDDSLEPGRRRYNWAWYRAADEATLREHLTDSEGRYYPSGIPHDRIRESLREAMRESARQSLPPQMQAIIAATERPFLQPIFDFGTTWMRRGHCLLIGDAAFTARPHVGMGVSKAAEDAETLVEALSGASPERALEGWEHARLRFGRAVLAWSRDLGRYVPESVDGTDRYDRHPEVLLVDTAASDPEPYLAVRESQ